MSRDLGPTHKPVNCNSWGTYEEEDSSPEANLCHGGEWNGRNYRACPSRYDCARATQRNMVQPPVAQSSYREPSRSRVLYSPPPMRSLTRPGQHRSADDDRQTPPQHPPHPSATTVERGVPISPPSTYPPAMQTPFMPPGGYPSNPITPVFLPGKEGVVKRLAKNTVQGALGGAAQQVVEYLRYVDIFGAR